jgi:hypothetical protein
MKEVVLNLVEVLDQGSTHHAKEAQSDDSKVTVSRSYA